MTGMWCKEGKWGVFVEDTVMIWLGEYLQDAAQLIRAAESRTGEPDERALAFAIELEEQAEQTIDTAVESRLGLSRQTTHVNRSSFRHGTR